MDNNSLRHYGIPGQKHGLRRYQYSDGTLTPLGKIRYRKMKREYEKARDFERLSKIKQEANEEKKPSVKDLTDAELRERINRLQMEKQFAELTKQPEVKKGKSFFSQLGDNLKSKVASEIPDLLVKQGRKMLESSLFPEQPKPKDPLSELEKEFKAYNYKNQIRKIKAELGED